MAAAHIREYKYQIKIIRHYNSRLVKKWAEFSAIWVRQRFCWLPGCYSERMVGWTGKGFFHIYLFILWSFSWHWDRLQLEKCLPWLQTCQTENLFLSLQLTPLSYFFLAVVAKDEMGLPILLYWLMQIPHPLAKANMAGRAFQGQQHPCGMWGGGGAVICRSYTQKLQGRVSFSPSRGCAL